MNKKGQSSGFTYIVALLVLGVLAILFMVFNQAIGEYILPLSKTMVNASPYLNATENADTLSFIDKGSFFWDIIPIVFFLLIMVYVVVNTMIKNKDEMK